LIDQHPQYEAVGVNALGCQGKHSIDLIEIHKLLKLFKSPVKINVQQSVRREMVLRGHAKMTPKKGSQMLGAKIMPNPSCS
jgi:hypothetical protein